MKIVKAQQGQQENNELEMGIEVEKEHQDVYDFFKKIFDEMDKDMPISAEELFTMIAKSHISEMKNYYTELKKMESK